MRRRGTDVREVCHDCELFVPLFLGLSICLSVCLGVSVMSSKHVCEDLTELKLASKGLDSSLRRKVPRPTYECHASLYRLEGLSPKHQAG